ncbi:MAG: ribosome-associated translation inhibitor RaiA [Nitrospirota bacterium]|nr:ribosome-associated translation inhibitor RaiA [Nitrospirota bacterium]
MNIIISGRHLEVTPAIKQYAKEKISKFERYLSNISEAVVTLSVEKYRHKAEVLFKVNGVMIQAEGVTGEIYSSIDQVSEKLERQVKKYKEKFLSHRKGGNRVSSEPKEKPSTATEGGIIIKNKHFELKPMSHDEASMQMELLDKDFFVFLNDITNDINVIYLRLDGNFGLIEPVR